MPTDNDKFTKADSLAVYNFAKQHNLELDKIANLPLEQRALAHKKYQRNTGAMNFSSLPFLPKSDNRTLNYGSGYDTYMKEELPEERKVRPTFSPIPSYIPKSTTPTLDPIEVAVPEASNNEPENLFKQSYTAGGGRMKISENGWVEYTPQEWSTMNRMAYGGEIPKYGWGSVTGSLVGAGIGTLIAPGIGTTLGAQLGSGIGGMAENRIKENQMIDAGQELPLENGNNKILMDTVGGVGKTLMSTMAYGGKVFNPNSEVEDKEVGLMPNGRTEVFKGDLHGEDNDNDGFEGIPKELPEGTKIFSDRLKVGNKTFANVAKKFSNDKWQIIVDNPRANNIDKETAKLMMVQNNDKLNSLFKEQESMKFKKGMPSEFAYGGMYKKKYAFGGINKDEILPIPGLESTMVPNATFDTQGSYTGMPFFENVNTKFKGFDIPSYTGNQTPRTSLLESANNPIAAVPDSPQSVTPVTPAPGTDWRNLLEKGAMYAPTIYNTGMGLLSRPEQLDRDAFTSRDRLEAGRLNIDPALRAIDEQAQTGRTAAKSSGFSRGSYLSNIANINTQAESQKAKTMVDAENLNRQNKQGVDTFNINLGLSDEQQRRQNYDFNLKSKAKKSEFLGKGLEGISGITQVNKLMGNQQDSDRIRLGTLNSILQNYEIPADLQEKILNKSATPEDYANIYKFKKNN
jgi:hypothetical protein